MTVQELINELSKYPKDKKVYTDNIKVNLRGEIVLTHEDIREEEQKREEIARRDREWEEEMERGSKVDGKIHNMTYNPTDKVKPEFKVGDCVVNNNSGSVCQVTEIRDDEYCLWPIYSEIQGYLRIIDVDTDYHLWTIADANEGEVLVCDINKAEIGGDVEKLPNITPTIFIYQNVVKDSEYIHSYCSLYDENSLVLQNTMYYNAFVYNIHPATKGQRDLLFQKMKETGYEWDSEKKELKKIEPKKLDADKVIEWLDEHVPTKFEDMQNYVNQFKKDFGLC